MPRSRFVQLGPDYANWVSSKLIYVPLVLAVVLGLCACLSVWFLIPASLLCVVAAYFGYARRALGTMQSAIIDLLIDHLDWNGEGRVLDIGCGNGQLSIAIAKAYPNACVVGIDHWGPSWDYSKSLCERNAELEGVADRVSFLRASAATLPFEDRSFDAVVSNLVFHEVKDVRDKKLLLRESLRVLKPCGSFAFQDLFLWELVFGRPAEILEAVRLSGGDSVQLVPTNDSSFIPKALKLPFMLGTIAILAGVMSDVSV